MDWKQDKQQIITRLALCVILAVVLYMAVDKVGGNIPQLAPYKPLLAKNKVQAIAIAAAVLFGVSLAAFPLDRKTPAVPPPPPAPEGDPCDPCGGYERAGDLP